MEFNQPPDGITLGKTHAIILAQLQAQRTGLEAGLDMQRKATWAPGSTSLSGGQKQPVLLARALYRCAKRLVPDEATLQLDIDRKRQGNAVIKRMKLTRLVRMHRPETLVSAARVIVLQAGRAQSVASPQSGVGGVAEAETVFYSRR